MSGSHIFDRQRFLAYLGYVCCALLIITLAAGCGDDNAPPAQTGKVTTESSGTGSASFSIQWHTAADDPDSPSTNALVRQAIQDCTAAGVETITCEVYNESNTSIASRGPWPCDAHGANVGRIPAGPNRTFVVLGWDATGGNVIYRGRTTSGIDITPGATADAGTIDAIPFLPTGLTATAISSSQIDLNWNDMGDTDYRIYQNGTMIATAPSQSSPPYSVTRLTPATQYCFTISAYDVFGIESGLGHQVCSTTADSDDTQVPTVPSGLAATTASASQIDLVWTESTDNVGVAGYRIYRDGTEVGTAASPSFSDTGLISNTAYCYTVEAHDAAGNPSARGDQACATTNQSFDWFRDGDNDRYGDPGDTITSETQPTGYVSDNTDCDDGNPSINPGTTEVCNNIDDNCSDGIDEALSRSTACGVGACGGNTGTETCSAGVWTNDTCDPLAGAVAETCDNVDNDCDGTVDEDLSQPTTCGIGPCAGNTGTETCSAGAWTNNTCDPLAGASPEACDSVDNDCDGTVDEDLSQTTNCGVGACAGNTGTETCSAGAWVNNTCNPLAGAVVEACDNVDNDCDGAVDENLSQQTTCGVGACAGNTGTETCSAGAWINDTCEPLAGASPEVCDDVDNDCDGQLNEGCPVCYPNLPTPDLVLTGIEMSAWATVTFAVTNRAAYPDDMFTPSSAYPACDTSTEGSRSVVRIYDGNHNLMREFCNFTSSNDLASFGFGHSSLPNSVYIQITDRECDATYTSNLVPIWTPVQIAPANGTVFDHFPRTTTLQWQGVAGAISYTVEVDCYHCCQIDQWCTDIGQTWQVNPGIEGDTFTFDFVGAQPGRWRVWAVDPMGYSGPASGWWGFEYRR